MGTPDDDLERIRERLDADAAFRAALERDPQAALAEYALDVDALSAVEALLRDDEVVGFQQLFPSGE